MNERLKRMMPCPFVVDTRYSTTPMNLYTEGKMLMYAELVLRECLKLCRNEEDRLMIEQHFGLQNDSKHTPR